MKAKAAALLLASFLLSPTLRAEEEEKTVTLAEIKISGLIQEGVSKKADLLFSTGQMKTLQSLLGRIETAKKDKNVDGMLLKIQGPGMGMGKTEAIRRALHDFRSSGKKIHVFMEGASTKEYLLAVAANDISMAPAGFLLLPGLRFEMTYMKGLLDWLGVKADVIHIGKFKNAYENLYREDMSEGQKEALGAILDGFYEIMVKAIAADRGISQERVKKAVDLAMLTPAQARGRGLIDNVEYEDQFRDRLRKEYEADLEVIKKYGKQKKREFNPNDFTAIFSLFGEMMKKPSIPAGDKIAVIYAIGPIHSGESQQQGPFGGEPTIGSDTMVKAIREAAGREDVKAIVLRVDSPGGSGLASDVIWRELILAKKKKPLVVSMSDVAGSGGYYIAMPANAIVAEPGTITGSIGVIGMKLVTGGMWKKVGMNTQVLQRGERAGMFSSEKPFTDQERDLMRGLLESFYNDFVQKVADGRGQSFENMEAIARGRIWTGKQAREIGLVDELGGLDTAIRLAKQEAGLNPKADLPVWELPRPKSFLDLLEEGFPLGIEVSLDAQPALQAMAAQDQARQALDLLRVLERIQGPNVMLMPLEWAWK